MSPNIELILVVVVSSIMATMIAIAWAKFSLFVGAVLKRRYTKIRDITQESGALSNLNNPSYHSGNQRQQSGQQTKPAHAINGIYQIYRHWIVGLIDGIFEPLYRHINHSPQKQYQEKCTSTKDNGRNFKGFIHTDKSITGGSGCQPKKNDTVHKRLIMPSKQSYFVVV